MGTGPSPTPTGPLTVGTPTPIGAEMTKVDADADPVGCTEKVGIGKLADGVGTAGADVRDFFKAGEDMPGDQEMPLPCLWDLSFVIEVSTPTR